MNTIPSLRIQSDVQHKTGQEQPYPSCAWGSGVKICLLMALACLWLNVCTVSHADTVAITIAAEAANQGQIGMYAVACTIANRARAWHKTPYEIVSAKNQYYGFTAPNRLKRYAEVKEYADYLASNIMDLEDNTGGALYFLLPNEHERSWHKVKTVCIKDHCFYK